MAIPETCDSDEWLFDVGLKAHLNFIASVLNPSKTSWPNVHPSLLPPTHPFFHPPIHSHLFTHPSTPTHPHLHPQTPTHQPIHTHPPIHTHQQVTQTRSNVTNELIISTGCLDRQCGQMYNTKTCTIGPNGEKVSGV